MTRNRKMQQRARRMMAVLSLLITLAGCAGEPLLVPLAQGESLPSNNSSFLYDLANLTAINDPHSGVSVFENDAEALVAKVRLIDGAKSTLDVRYPGWTNDERGQFLLARLQSAAQRGIRVRLLLDAADTAAVSPVLAAFNAQQNMQIRLLTANAKAGAPHLQHRQLTTDNNVSMADMAGLRVDGLGLPVSGDVLVVGPVMPAMARCFFVDWNSQSASDIAVQPGDVTTAPTVPATYPAYSEALRTSRIARVSRASELAFVWGDVKLRDEAAATRGCQ